MGKRWRAMTARGLAWLMAVPPALVLLAMLALLLCLSRRLNGCAAAA